MNTEKEILPFPVTIFTNEEHTIQVSLSHEEYVEFRNLIDNSVFDEAKWLKRTIIYGIKVAKRNLDRKYSLTIPSHL